MPGSIRKDDKAKQIAIEILGEPINSYNDSKKKKKKPNKNGEYKTDKFYQFEYSKD